MYPIHAGNIGIALSCRCFHEVGDLYTRPEDEISAIAFAIGSSYAGKTACTITSGPGLALKTELLGIGGDGRDSAGTGCGTTRWTFPPVCRPKLSRATHWQRYLANRGCPESGGGGGNHRRVSAFRQDEPPSG